MRGGRELLAAMVAWERTLEELINLPRKEPPEKLKVEDLRTLATRRHLLNETFLDMEDELGGEHTMLTRVVVAERLGKVNEQARKVLEHSIRLREGLTQFEEAGVVVLGMVGLTEDWLTRAQGEYQAISTRWDVHIRVAMPELKGCPWREVWAILEEGEQGY